MLSLCRIVQYELSNVLIQRLYAEPYTRSTLNLTENYGLLNMYYYINAIIIYDMAL